jgi:glycerol uptake facilitator-like aquaporin
LEISLKREALSEAVGTAFLLCAIVGSGITGDRLSQGNAAIALLANSIATGAALVALILTFGPISGAHLNPAVTIASAWQGALPWRKAMIFIVCQIIGAFVGVISAHVMFGEPVLMLSENSRAGFPKMVGEFVATFGLLATIYSCTKVRPSMTPFAVAAYIMSAYWFTSSTSFANPAVTLARSFTNTFSGIRLIDAPGFIAAQLLGAGAAMRVFGWLLLSKTERNHE